MEKKEYNYPKLPNPNERYVDMMDKELQARRQAHCICKIRDNLYQLLIMRHWCVDDVHVTIKTIEMLIEHKPINEVIDYIKKNNYDMNYRY